MSLSAHRLDFRHLRKAVEPSSLKYNLMENRLLRSTKYGLNVLSPESAGKLFDEQLSFNDDSDYS